MLPRLLPHAHAHAHALRRRVLCLLRWPTRGVKVMVLDASDRLLLVRHSYGATHLWMLPGGGIGWREAPAAAAAREVWEETGCRVCSLRPLGTFRALAEGRRDTVHLFVGRTDDTPHPDGVEVLEARFFPPGALPDATSAATLRRVAELAGATRSALW